jgi:hypothetical protein
MGFSFDGATENDHRTCHACGEEHDTAHGYMLRDGSAHATYWADWYPHERIAIVDVTLGSWEEPDFRDNVMFTCQIRDAGDGANYACALVQAGQTRGDGPVFGRKLSRDEALRHEWLAAFWDVVDWLVLNDSLLHKCVFHAPPKTEGATEGH